MTEAFLAPFSGIPETFALHVHRNGGLCFDNKYSSGYNIRALRCAAAGSSALAAGALG